MCNFRPFLTDVTPKLLPKRTKFWKKKTDATIKFFIWNNIPVQIFSFWKTFLGDKVFMTLLTPKWPSRVTQKLVKFWKFGKMVVIFALESKLPVLLITILKDTVTGWPF